VVRLTGGVLRDAGVVSSLNPDFSAVAANAFSQAALKGGNEEIFAESELPDPVLSGWLQYFRLVENLMVPLSTVLLVDNWP
jgi:hypothetical protein